jgi:heme exporter protein CcmB
MSREEVSVAAPAEVDSGFLTVLKDSLVIAGKDLKVEWRSKEILLTMGYFGFLVVLIFSFAFFSGEAPISAVAAGILWVSVAFAGTLGLGRAFEREREGDCIRALLLSPVARPAIYLGKAMGLFLFMVVVELVVVPAVIFFFNVPEGAAFGLGRLWRLSLTVGLGTLGYAIIGTLLAAMLLRAHAKDVLLAIIFYPIILPVLVIGVKATTALFEPEMQLEQFGLLLRVLLFFDVIFLVASLWMFEALLMD